MAMNEWLKKVSPNAYFENLTPNDLMTKQVDIDYVCIKPSGNSESKMPIQVLSCLYNL